MIAAYVLGDSSIRLKDIAFNRLGIEMTEISELIGTGKNQATMDTVDDRARGALCLWRCGVDVRASSKPLKAQIEERDQTGLLESIEFPLITVLMQMERAGVAINPEELAEFSEELGRRIDTIKLEVNKIAGAPINLGSNKQLATLLFEDLGLQSGRKTKTGYSVDSEVLEVIRDAHPIVDLILEYRTLSKLKSTYVDSLPNEINPETGRVHTSFNQTIAATGRLSSVTPNLQNIPIRTDIGRRVRRSFVADHRPDLGLYDDRDPAGRRLLPDGTADPGPHVRRAVPDRCLQGRGGHPHGRRPRWWWRDADEVTADQRAIAKTVNFGILYGMQAYGLSRDTGMARGDAQEFINAYWERLPR